MHRSKGKENLSYIKDICYGERYEQHKKVLNVQMQYAIIKTKLKPWKIHLSVCVPPLSEFSPLDNRNPKPLARQGNWMKILIHKKLLGQGES